MRPIRSGKPDSLFELTDRTQNGAWHLTPVDDVNKIVLGCIAKAQQHYPVRLHAFVFMSNHCHLLVSCDDARQLASFMGFLKCNIARKTNRLLGRRGALWERRYRAIAVTLEDAAQIDRLRYVLAHGVKERLVATAREWPGASSLPWLVDGKELEGTWHSLTDEYKGTRTSKARAASKPSDFDTVLPIEMSPLPCWAHLPEQQWRALVAEMVAGIEAELSAEAEAADPPLEVLGVPAILAQDPLTVPRHCKRSPAPSVHAGSQAERRRWKRRQRSLRSSYAQASQRFRGGEHGVVFPFGTFRPLGGFVGWPPEALAMS